MKLRLPIVLALLACLAIPGVSAAGDLFFADFQSGPQPQFSKAPMFRLDNLKVLGIFNNKNRKLPGGTTLTLDKTPAGKPMVLTFDLYLIGNWESRGMSLSDRFTVQANDEQVFLLDQFPCKIKDNDEAQAVDSLGMVAIKDHVLGYWMVPVKVNIPATDGGPLELAFHARLSGQGTEFWALDNVRVATAE